jgi:hypothetical protein
MAAIREWYSGYSIIYNWFEDHYGEQELYKYWKYIAKEIYSDLAEEFKTKGLPFIRDYFKEIIEEDLGSVTFEQDANSLTVDVIEMPDHIWQKEYLEIGGMPRDNYYRSYEVIYGEVAKMAGLEFELLRFDTEGKLKFKFTDRRVAA